MLSVCITDSFVLSCTKAVKLVNTGQHLNLIFDISVLGEKRL